MKGTFKIPGTFPGTFQFVYCGSSDNLIAFTEKGKQS